MKLLYFPGIKSLIDKDYDMAQSCKLVHLMKICECRVFNYHTYDPEKTPEFIKKYDILFGSSFGGFFAFNLAVETNQKCISVSPSLYLDKRLASLAEKHPNELRFITASHLSALKKEPKGSHRNIHVLMNLDDEVLNAEKVLGIAQEYDCNTYTFDKGGHDCTNFIGEMLPLIKQILAG